MSRNGKIARLPQSIREQINRRLLNGEEARSIIKWLNSTPEVRALLAAEFDGQPINKVNMSHWKSGGYRDWLAEQQAQDAIRSIVESSGALHDKIPENFGHHMNHLLLGTLAAEFIQAQRNANPAKRSEAFGEWVLRYARIRRADCQARRLDIEHDRLAVQRNKADANFDEKCWKWAAQDHIRAQIAKGLVYTEDEKRRRSAKILGIEPRVSTDHFPPDAQKVAVGEPSYPPSTAAIARTS